MLYNIIALEHLCSSVIHDCVIINCLYSPITFSLVFSHSVPFQRYEFTNEIILVPVFLSPLIYPKFLIP